MALADWGGKEISIAEHEMPGLMSVRKKYAPLKPLKGVRVTGSLHMTIQTAALIETLEEYWWCTAQAINFPGGKGPELVVDDGGDVTLLIHKGYELEEGSDWVETTSANKEEQVIKDLLLEIQRENPYRWHELVKDWQGVSEETTPGVDRGYKMAQEKRLQVPPINVNDS